MYTFENGMTVKSREFDRPTVARFKMSDGTIRFVVVGTAYGYVHTSSGDVRTWASYSGARRFARNYVKF